MGDSDLTFASTETTGAEVWGTESPNCSYPFLNRSCFAFTDIHEASVLARTIRVSHCQCHEWHRWPDQHTAANNTAQPSAQQKLRQQPAP